MTEEDDILEFEGNYLGGHAMFPDRCPVILQLSDEYLFVAPYAPGQCLGPPFLSILFTAISNAQNVPSERAFPNLIQVEGDNYLTLTFTDELDKEQMVVFKIKKTEKAISIIYERVAEAKAKAKQQYDT